MIERHRRESSLETENPNNNLKKGKGNNKTKVQSATGDPNNRTEPQKNKKVFRWKEDPIEINHQTFNSVDLTTVPILTKYIYL